MTRGRWLSNEDFEREVEAARRMDRGVIEHFQRRTKARGWKGGDQ